MLGAKTWTVTGILTALILGFLLGVLASRSVSLTTYPYQQELVEEILNERLLARLSRKLNLTKPQLQAIGGILRVQAVKLKNTKEEYQNKIVKIKDDAHQKVREHLSPLQLERYDKLAEYHRKRMENICPVKESSRH